jgi:TonB-linked SusC/RagA family outer membrane protein
MWNFKSLQKPLMALFLLCLFPMGALAQGTVKGTVVDEAGEAIIGASVQVQGAKTGAITDFNGNFSVQAASNATLVISYVGYVTETVKVNGRSNIDIILKEDITTLNDVVVIGYGVQKKSDLTGAVASVKGEDIKNLSTTDAGAALQGKVTGVQIINSGSPGAGASIRVRGYSSNSGSIGPLLIVDGLKVDNIQYLDPTMIESMEVLKDAASAAIYGAQAGNGVVIITTKNGTKGQAKVTYNLKAASQSLGKKSELFNAKNWIEYHKYLGDLTESELVSKGYYAQTTKNADGTDIGVAGTERFDTDWYDEVFENSWSLQHNITVEGGNDKGRFLVGLGIVDNDGIVKGNKDTYKRFTGQLNADYKFFDWLNITSNTSIEKWKRKALGNGYGSFLNAVVSIDPLTPAYIYDEADFGDGVAEAWATGSPYPVLLPPDYTEANPVWYGTSKYIVEATGNPLARRDVSDSSSEGVNVRGSLAANITPFDGFTFTSRLGYRISQSNGHSYGFPWYLSSMANSGNYSISANTNASLYYQWENFANYMKQLGKHNIGAMVGMSFTKNHWDNTSASSSDTQMILRGNHAPNFRYIDCLNDNGKAHLSVGNAPGDATELSYFGRLSYSFDDRYFLQFNFRADAFDSSKLSKDNRWGYFPSVSAGWTISNEPFFKNAISTSAVSFLKLRGSWGRNGNVNVLSGYKYNPTIGLGGYYVFNDESSNGGATEGGSPNGAANPDLTWETAEQIDLGLDARFLDNRLSIGFDWYRKKTKDLLVDIKPYPEVGVSTITVNSGEILNTGFDIEAGWRDHIGDFKYSINANFSPLKNEVRAVNEFLSRYSQGGISGFNQKVGSTFEAGHTIWYFRGYEYLGVYSKDTYGLVGDTELNEANIGKPLYGGMVPVLDDAGEPTYDAEGNKITKWGAVFAPNEDTDMVDLGAGIPKFTYGITLNCEYKGFDLTVFGTGASGNKIYNLMVSADRPRVNGLNTWWLDSWRSTANEDGTTSWTEGAYPDMKYVAKDWIFFSSSANVFSGAYFKFKQIQLGYTLPQSITRKFMVNNLRLSVSLDDFFTITSYPGADPETASFDNGASRGWDNGNYPTSKKIVFGVNVSF